MSETFGQAYRQETEEVQGGSIAPPAADVSRKSVAQASAKGTVDSNFQGIGRVEKERVDNDSAKIMSALLSVAGSAAEVITKEQNRKKALEGARMAGTEEGREAIYAAAASDEREVQLAKLSEEENYNMKNWYRHARRTMDWADKSRMPVDERKVRDMLRNQHIVRNKVQEEVQTYDMEEKNPMLEHGILQYVNDAAHGDLKALINDVGINRDSIPFVNYAAQ